jgi:anti-sigma factor RsiW
MSDPHASPGEDRLQAYVDGQLDPDAQEAVEIYLENNPDEASRIHAYAAHREGLRNALSPYTGVAPSRGLSISQLVKQRRAARYAPWRLVATIALTLCVGGGAGWMLRGVAMADDRGNSIAALTQEALINHVVYTADYGHPVEMVSNQTDGLVRWLSGRLSRQLRVPDLEQAGYHLMGGRLLATDRGPAALLMYDDDRGTRLTVFARPTTMPHQDTPTEAVGAQPVTGYAWICGGLGYVVLGTVEAQALRSLASLVRHQVDPT